MKLLRVSTSYLLKSIYYLDATIHKMSFGFSDVFMQGIYEGLLCINIGSYERLFYEWASSSGKKNINEYPLLCSFTLSLYLIELIILRSTLFNIYSSIRANFIEYLFHLNISIYVRNLSIYLRCF